MFALRECAREGKATTMSSLQSTTGELCVWLDCHSVGCALPSRWVERLLAIGDGRLLPPKNKRSKIPVLQVGARRFAAWDLADMLGIPSAPKAWVLLKIPSARGAVPIALRTGECLAVEPTGEALIMPAGLFRRRGAAFPRAFTPPQSVRARADIVVALGLEPSALWSQAELDASIEALASEERS